MAYNYPVMAATAKKVVTYLIAKGKNAKVKVARYNSTIKAVEEAEKKAEMALKEMTMMKVQLDSVATVTEENSWMYQGALYEEWKQYRDSGGTSDFEYYRLYKN